MLDPGQKKGSYFRGGSKKGTNPRGDALEQAYALKQARKLLRPFPKNIKPNDKKWGPPKRKLPKRFI